MDRVEEVLLDKFKEEVEDVVKNLGEDEIIRVSFAEDGKVNIKSIPKSKFFKNPKQILYMDDVEMDICDFVEDLAVRAISQLEPEDSTLSEAEIEDLEKYVRHTILDYDLYIKQVWVEYFIGYALSDCSIETHHEYVRRALIDLILRKIERLLKIEF